MGFLLGGSKRTTKPVTKEKDAYACPTQKGDEANLWVWQKGERGNSGGHKREARSGGGAIFLKERGEGLVPCKSFSEYNWGRGRHQSSGGRGGSSLYQGCLPVTGERKCRGTAWNRGVCRSLSGLLKGITSNWETN